MFMIAVVLLAAIFGAAKWRVFQKMGYEGWKSLVPVYETFLTFKAIYGSGWMMLVLYAPVIAALPVSILFAVGGVLMNVRDEVASILGGIVLLAAGLVSLICGLLPLIYSIKLNFDKARAFHKSKAFGFALWVVGPVMDVVLAFSNAVFHNGDKFVCGDDAISCLITKADNWIRGSKKVSVQELTEAFRSLQELHEQGMIDDAAFERKRAELLTRL